MKKKYIRLASGDNVVFVFFVSYLQMHHFLSEFKQVNFQYDYLKRPTTINILKVYFIYLAFFDLRPLIINTKYAYTIHVKSVGYLLHDEIIPSRAGPLCHASSANRHSGDSVCLP